MSTLPKRLYTVFIVVVIITGVSSPRGRVLRSFNSPNCILGFFLRSRPYAGFMRAMLSHITEHDIASYSVHEIRIIFRRVLTFGRFRPVRPQAPDLIHPRLHWPIPIIIIVVVSVDGFTDRSAENSVTQLTPYKQLSILRHQ